VESALDDTPNLNYHNDFGTVFSALFDNKIGLFRALMDTVEDNINNNAHLKLHKRFIRRGAPHQKEWADKQFDDYYFDNSIIALIRGLDKILSEPPYQIEVVS
jgi:hypothetical protein